MDLREKKYFPEIDVLKGFAIFLVVLGHSIIEYPVNLHDIAPCNWLFNFVSSVHMPLFFFLSGFVFKYRGGYGSYLGKKAKRVLIPYLIFTLIDMVPRAFLGVFFNRSKDLGKSLTDMLLFGGAKWFLYVLFFIYMIYPAVWLLHKNRRAALLIIEGVLLIPAIMSADSNLLAFAHVDLNWGFVDALDLSWFAVKSLMYFMFFFHSGLVVRSFYSDIKAWFDRQSPAVIIPCSVVLTAAWCVSLTFLPREWRILMACLGILTCYSLTKWGWFSKAFQRFGGYTLQIYLLNSWMLGISRTIICSLLHVTFPPVIIVFNMIVDFLLSYLLIKYVLKRFRVIRFMMGM